ncbi:MAG: hypothetical protein HYZ43_15330, partial [Flavobacteriia bacterium]|nr:hypothetical protein [Flavobacteriia bacterium]
MEFKISSKAKLLTLTLMIVGGISTIIGCVLEMGNHEGAHFAQRFLANALVDSFFFFAIGLGALFFLALQYATETGWYASVKRVIEAVTGFMPYGVGLMIVTLLAITFMDGAHIYVWMDPNVVEHDSIIEGKSMFLNKGFFWIRTVVYLAVYVIFWWGFRK